MDASLIPCASFAMGVSGLLAFWSRGVGIGLAQGVCGSLTTVPGAILFFGALLLVLGRFLFWRGAGRWPVILS